MRDLGLVRERILSFAKTACIFGTHKRGDMDKRIEIIKKDNFVELITDETADVYMKDGKEVIEIKTPRYLTDYVSAKVDLSERKEFTVLVCFVPVGYYNAVTDKKGVWGLTKQHRGVFESSYITENGKVYFGITDGIEKKTVKGITAVIEIYIPEKNAFPCEKVFEMFVAADCDMLSDDINDDILLEKVREAIPDAIIIDRASSSVKLYGGKIEKLF
jgi:hypothetical protein